MRLHRSLSQKIKEPLPQVNNIDTTTAVDVTLCLLGA